MKRILLVLLAALSFALVLPACQTDNKQSDADDQISAGNFEIANEDNTTEFSDNTDNTGSIQTPVNRPDLPPNIDDYIPGLDHSAINRYAQIADETPKNYSAVGYFICDEQENFIKSEDGIFNLSVDKSYYITFYPLEDYPASIGPVDICIPAVDMSFSTDIEVISELVNVTANSASYPHFRFSGLKACNGTTIKSFIEGNESVTVTINFS